MPDWAEVTDAYRDADAARDSLDSYGGAVEDGRSGDLVLAVLIAATALTAELRANTTAIRWELAQLARATYSGNV